MTERASHSTRRAFVELLVGSPLAAWLAACVQAPPKGTGAAGSTVADRLSLPEQPIASADEAIDVFDLEAAARRNLPPAHFGYLQTGVDGDVTLRANQEAFAHWYLRPHRLVDVSSVDTSVRLFGVEWKSPIIVAPVGSQRAFHPEGELATARAARAQGHLMILSTVTSTPIEAGVEARGGGVWYQLYPTGKWEITEKLVRRAERAGCPAIVLTVDIPGGIDNRETLQRAMRRDARDCKQCHVGPDQDISRKPMFQGTGLTGRGDYSQAALTWDFLRRLRDSTRVKLLVKGIVTAEDAGRCLAAGVDGIVVSNHGGRADDTGRATLDTLPEIVQTVRRRVPVLVDSGFRRGSDIFKGLALGADAVCVGRPYLWGLAAFGQAGVERALGLLRKETESVMRFVGTPSIRRITKEFVART